MKLDDNHQLGQPQERRVTGRSRHHWLIRPDVGRQEKRRDRDYPEHHPDNHDLVFFPGDPRQALSANDGGIYQSPDVLAVDQVDGYHPISWTNLNTNYPVSILFNVSIDHATSKDETILGGFQDQGAWVGR